MKSAIVGILAALTICSWMERRAAAHDPDEIPAVRPCKNQDEAVRLAREEDLPAIEQADRLEILLIGEGVDFAPRIAVTKAADIREILGLLRVRMTPDLESESEFSLIFYRKEKPIREIWVYPDGTWGVDRPGGGNATGRSPALAESLREWASRKK